MDISGLLDESSLFAGRRPFLSVEELGLSEPSHGTNYVYISLIVESMFDYSVVMIQKLQLFLSHQRMSPKRTCFIH